MCVRIRNACYYFILKSYYITLIYIYRESVCGHVLGLVHVWTSEDSLWASVLSFTGWILRFRLRLSGGQQAHLPTEPAHWPKNCFKEECISYM